MKIYIVTILDQHQIFLLNRVCALSRNKKLNKKLCNGQSQKIVIL